MLARSSPTDKYLRVTQTLNPDLTTVSPSAHCVLIRTIWPRLRVLARCSPSDKYLLVTAIKQLRQEGGFDEVVAMTGEAGS